MVKTLFSFGQFWTSVLGKLKSHEFVVEKVRVKIMVRRFVVVCLITCMFEVELTSLNN